MVIDCTLFPVIKNGLALTCLNSHERRVVEITCSLIVLQSKDQIFLGDHPDSSLADRATYRMPLYKM